MYSKKTTVIRTWRWGGSLQSVFISKLCVPSCNLKRSTKLRPHDRTDHIERLSKRRYHNSNGKCWYYHQQQAASDVEEISNRLLPIEENIFQGNLQDYYIYSDTNQERDAENDNETQNDMDNRR